MWLPHISGFLCLSSCFSLPFSVTRQLLLKITNCRCFLAVRVCVDESSGVLSSLPFYPRFPFSYYFLDKGFTFECLSFIKVANVSFSSSGMSWSNLTSWCSAPTNRLSGNSHFQNHCCPCSLLLAEPNAFIHTSVPKGD